MRSPALNELLDLLAKDFKVDWVQTDQTAGSSKEVVEVRLRKGGLEATVKASDRDFCDYASSLYSSP